MPDYIWKRGERLELVESNPGEGQTTYEAEQLSTPAEQETLRTGKRRQKADLLAQQIAESREIDWLFGQLLFEVLRAGRTGDYTFFDGVTDRNSFFIFVRGLLRDRLSEE